MALEQATKLMRESIEYVNSLELSASRSVDETSLPNIPTLENEGSLQVDQSQVSTFSSDFVVTYAHPHSQTSNNSDSLALSIDLVDSNPLTATSVFNSTVGHRLSDSSVVSNSIHHSISVPNSLEFQKSQVLSESSAIQIV
jgi:hypothetical protein